MVSSMHGDRKARLAARLRRIEGQVGGIIRMVEDERYCVDVLTQIDAVRAALHKAQEEILRDHVSHCVAGALASGKAGFMDQATSASTRYYDPVAVSVPDTDPSVLYSGRSMVVRHDDTVREDAAGVGAFGRVRPYRGSRFHVPPGLGRFAVTARRLDRDLAGADWVTDATSVQVGVTPQYLVVPR